MAMQKAHMPITHNTFRVRVRVMVSARVRVGARVRVRALASGRL